MTWPKSHLPIDPSTIYRKPLDKLPLKLAWILC